MSDRNPHLKNSILTLLAPKSDGLTWKELQVLLREDFEIHAHHGQISGALSKLHQESKVFRIIAQREKCDPYVSVAYRGQYPDDDCIDVPYSSKEQVKVWREAAYMWRTLAEVDEVTPEMYRKAVESFERAENG